MRLSRNVFHTVSSLQYENNMFISIPSYYYRLYNNNNNIEDPNSITSNERQCDCHMKKHE